MHDRIDAVGSQPRVCQFCQRADSHVQQAGEPRADDTKGQPKNQAHDADKGRNRGVLSGQDLIDLDAARVFFAFVRFDDRCFADLLYEGKAHVRDRCGLIHAAFFLHLTDDMPQHFFFIFF